MVRIKRQQQQQRGKTRKRQTKTQNKRNTLSFKEATAQIKRQILNEKPTSFYGVLKVAIKKANKIKNKIRPTRVIPIPKQGGLLPLIPIFAGLSALGALSGGAAGIAKAVNDAKAASAQLQEAKRHNKTMESIAIGKGLRMKRHKQGLGVFLYPPQDVHNYR